MELDFEMDACFFLFFFCTGWSVFVGILTIGGALICRPSLVCDEEARSAAGRERLKDVMSGMGGEKDMSHAIVSGG